MSYCKRTGLFWDKVDTDGDCWVWTAARTIGGYGHFNRAGKTIMAHRFAYEQVVGPIPEGLEVCHKCDNRLCVRPAHLFLGTRQDNCDDMKQKGRTSHGQTHHLAKLSDEDVLEIRRLYASGLASVSMLAKQFGVTPGNIWCVTTRKSWRHV